MIYTTGSTVKPVIHFPAALEIPKQHKLKFTTSQSLNLLQILNKHWRILTPSLANKVFRSVNLQIKSITCSEHFHSSQKVSMSIISQSTESSDLQDFQTEKDSLAHS